MTIKILIVDDEPLARDGVKFHLEAQVDIEIIGECPNAEKAIDFIQDHKPDLVFLDIKMPGKTGFDVIQEVGTDNMPLVIFMTAYDQYAIEAFQVNALDYLLKPINPTLFYESLNRARTEIKKKQISQYSQQLTDLLQGLNTEPGGIDAQNSERIVVRSHGHVYFVRPQDVQWVEAKGDYVTVHTHNRTHLLRETMRNMEKRLEGAGFQRIHRSLIVKVDLIIELISLDSGDYEVVIEGGTKLKLSRSYRDSLFAHLNS
ncbi:LytR/AlgR family response regulator transcription factor [Microbulbifer sp. 2304DJ12-6]|uniref:LytR/AlgR family response regulator transcription factor n=1 Tax=Microbulbifer sp. 2304DJ12-6 TaxID=3233340 RepID=UPI0039AEB1EE